MVPDFEFLLRLRDTVDYAHTWPGMVLYGLPFSVLLSFVFHLLVRNPLILHLPLPIQQRFTWLLTFRWKKHFRKHVPVFFISVMLGIGSHLLLDAFTHADGLFVFGNDFFNRELFTVAAYNVPVYFLLQLLGSLLGAAYIAWYVCRMPGGELVQVKRDYYGYWISLVLLGILLFVARLFVYPQYRSADDIINAFFGCFIYALLLVSVYFTHYARKIKNAL